MIFEADGTFTVTWFPFEVYKDYWGTYTFGLEQGTLTLTIDTGNYIPEEFDGEGTFTFEEGGRLVLRDIWLGASPDKEGAVAAQCGHVLYG
jgi:hypothetical protein